jgi:hypothetical protein
MMALWFIKFNWLRLPSIGVEATEDPRRVAGPGFEIPADLVHGYDWVR